MKYLKIFESYNWDLLPDVKIGDYVSIDASELSKFMIDYNVELYIDFLNNNIGKIININRVVDNIKVKYKNVPDNIKVYFNDYNSIFLHPSNVKYYSKSLDELKLKIDFEKYNL